MFPLSSPSCSTPRRRGAPRGNKNALGHGAPRGNRNALKFGVYTREFTRPMAQPPGVSLIEALELEIHRLRCYVRDNLASISPDKLDFRSSLALLRAMTIAVGRIRRLHRSIHALQTSPALGSPLGRSIARGLALFPVAARETGLAPAPTSHLSSSRIYEPHGVQVMNQPMSTLEQNNCLLVPLFSQDQMAPGPPVHPPDTGSWGNLTTPSVSRL